MQTNVPFPPQTNQQPVNPLSLFMRQPKVYLSLPSNSEFWAPNSLIISEENQYPVYSMTAKDELLLNIPDALMNGQAVVDVIQNCVPNIKNAWAIPSIDMDAILIAIRVATYGEMMKAPVKFNNDIEMDYQVNLTTLLGALMSEISWDPVIPINDNMVVYVRPLTYKQMSSSALQTYETQKILQLTNNNTINEADKIKMFKESFKKLTDSTVGMIIDSIDHIETSEGSTDNPAFIKEFINNADKTIFNTIQKHLEMLKERNSVKPMIVPVTDEMRDQGITGDTVEIPLVFDASNFFG